MKRFINFKIDLNFYKNFSRYYFPTGCIFFIGCFLALLSHFFFEMQSLNELEKHVVKMQVRLTDYKQVKIREKELLQRLENSDPFYVKTKLENFIPLETEIKKLQALTMYTKEDREKSERLAYLEKSNRLQFLEKNVRQNQTLKESELALIHPIEVDHEDLQKLLTLIEKESQNQHAPQLIIKEFELIKKPISKNQEVYQINLGLIKREKI